MWLGYAMLLAFVVACAAWVTYLDRKDEEKDNG